MVYTLNTLAGECLIVTLKRMKGTRTGDSQPRIQAFHFGFSDLEKNFFFFSLQSYETKSGMESTIFLQSCETKSEMESTIFLQSCETKSEMESTIFLQSCETKSGMKSMIFLQSCETKSRMDSLGSRLVFNSTQLQTSYCSSNGIFFRT